MNMHDTIEIRNLTAVELDEVSGGNPAWLGRVGHWRGALPNLPTRSASSTRPMQWKDGKWVVLGVPQ